MRLFSIACFSLIAAAFFMPGGIHNYSVTPIEGGNQSLADYEGKKILVITLPVQQSAAADSLLYCLDTLATAHISTLGVIAIPSREEGYTDEMKTELLSWYRSKLGNHILITEGMYTRKTSGAGQHPLFQWLTHHSQNGTFDIDETGPGAKFFANGQGKLFSVLGPQSRMYGRSVQRTLAMQ